MNDQIKHPVGDHTLVLEQHKIFWEDRILSNQVEDPIELIFGVKPIEIDMFQIGTNYKV